MSTRPKENRAWITPPEAAELAEVSSTTILNWCKDDQKLGKKVNKRWRINKDYLLKFLNGGEKNGKKK